MLFDRNQNFRRKQTLNCGFFFLENERDAEIPNNARIKFHLTRNRCESGRIQRQSCDIGKASVDHRSIKCPADQLGGKQSK